MMLHTNKKGKGNQKHMQVIFSIKYFELLWQVLFFATRSVKYYAKINVDKLLLEPIKPLKWMIICFHRNQSAQNSC